MGKLYSIECCRLHLVADNIVDAMAAFEFAVKGHYPARGSFTYGHDAYLYLATGAAIEDAYIIDGDELDDPADNDKALLLASLTQWEVIGGESSQQRYRHLREGVA